MEQPIVVEKLLHAPAEKVWKAITERDEMQHWYFKLADFQPVKGFRFTFTGGPSPEKQYVHLCEITEVIPGRKLSYTWRYEGYPGSSTVTFELFEKGNDTLLRLTHSGLETFPNDNADFARKNFEGGWDQIINHSLKDYVEQNQGTK